MRKTSVFILSCGLFLLLSTSVFAADMSVRGSLEKIDGKTLTIVDHKQRSTRIHLTPSTIAVSRLSKSKVDLKKMYRGSTVNATVRNGDVIVLVIEEEPK